MPESDKILPENSKANLDRKLDHAVKETVPTSDPVSVTITKGGAIDYDEKGQPIASPSEQGIQSTTDGLLNDAKETASALAGTATAACPWSYRAGATLCT